MASVESIGACSLDLETSAASDHYTRKQLTASELTLQSLKIAPSVNGCIDHGNDHETSVTKEKRKERAVTVNGHSERGKTECTIAEIKLPSYVSISCAINGYTNYSRFCRSRDNSPARFSFRKTSLDTTTEESSSLNKCPGSSVRYSRSYSECNGKVNSLYTESKHMMVSKQLEIPIKSSKKYLTEVTIESNGHSYEKKLNGDTSLHKTHENGCRHREFPLAKEVGIVPNKSLVQQRIESLYGSADKSKISGRISRYTEHHVNGGLSKSSISKRSPSCPPQTINNLGADLPVFRHLTNDFRKQLQLNGELKDRRLGNKLITKATQQSHPEKCAVNEKKILLLNGNDVNSSIISNGIDECDRILPTEPLSSIDSVSPSEEQIKSEQELKAGYKFLEKLKVEKNDILCHIKQWETELEKDMPEDASGKIRAACGKANLLLSQKFEQFKGLCLKNVEEDVHEQFYTTAEDLAGFWDMMMLPVKDVKDTFTELQQMKDNNWQEVSPTKSTPMPQKIRKPTSGSKSNPCTPKRTAKSVELARARDEARKQLMAAKKKGRQQNTGLEDSEINIFTPGSPS